MNGMNLDEIKAVFMARFQAEQKRQLSLAARLGQPTESSVVAEMMNERLAGIMAVRMLNDERSAPLISADDLTAMLPAIIDDIENRSANKMSEAERDAAGNFMVNAFNALTASLSAEFPHSDPYEDTRRWLDIVCDIATSKGISPVEVLNTQDGADEITRRMYSKDAYAEMLKKATGIFLEPDKLLDCMLKPLLEALVDDEALRAELEAEMSVEMIPELDEAFASVRLQVSLWQDDEIKRIFG